jgi:predicted transcriptional regulator
MFAAMRDPRYAKSEAYRQTVMDRMAKGVETQQSSTPAVPFQSDAEMVKAIQDPRYRKDEAYRQAVAARIAGKA